MALKINEELNTPDGGVVASGSLVKFSTIFPEKGYNVDYNLSIYRSETDYDNGMSKIRRINEFPNNYNLVLDQAGYLALDPEGVNEYLKYWVLEKLGYSSGATGIVEIQL